MSRSPNFSAKAVAYGLFFMGLFGAGYVNGLMKGGNDFARLMVCGSIILITGSLALGALKLMIKGPSNGKTTPDR